MHSIQFIHMDIYSVTKVATTTFWDPKTYAFSGTFLNAFGIAEKLIFYRWAVLKGPEK